MLFIDVLDWHKSETRANGAGLATTGGVQATWDIRSENRHTTHDGTGFVLATWDIR